MVLVVCMLDCHCRMNEKGAAAPSHSFTALLCMCGCGLTCHSAHDGLMHTAYVQSFSINGILCGLCWFAAVIFAAVIYIYMFAHAVHGVVDVEFKCVGC